MTEIDDPEVPAQENEDGEGAFGENPGAVRHKLMLTCPGLRC